MTIVVDMRTCPATKPRGALARTALALLATQLCIACSAPTPPAPAETPATTPSDATPPSVAIDESPPVAVPEPVVVPAPNPQPPQAQAATPPPPSPPPRESTPIPVPEPIAQTQPALQTPTTPRKPTIATPARTPPPQRPMTQTTAATTQTGSKAPGDAPASITVEMLSRGKGVPDETRAVFKQIHALLEQHQARDNVTTMQTKRMGLEGETRLCAQFRDRDEAEAALAEIRKYATGVDLLNISTDPCPSPKEATP